MEVSPVKIEMEDQYPRVRISNKRQRIVLKSNNVATVPPLYDRRLVYGPNGVLVESTVMEVNGMGSKPVKGFVTSPKNAGTKKWSKLKIVAVLAKKKVKKIFISSGANFPKLLVWTPTHSFIDFGRSSC